MTGRMSGVDTTGDDLEGELSSVTDEEWRAAHERLLTEVYVESEGEDEAAYLAAQFEYVWAPGRSADTYTVDMRQEMAAPTVWVPGDPDERFEGGGFRGGR